MSPNAERLIAAAVIDAPIVLWSSLALAAGVAIGAAVTRSLTIRGRFQRPLRRISQTVSRWIGGDWSERTELDGADDVRQVARQLNALAEHAQARMASLADEIASVKLLVDALPDPVLLTDARERVVVINAPAERLLQVPPKEVIGRPFVAAVNDPAILALFEACTRRDAERDARPGRAIDRELKLLRRGQRVIFHAHAEPARNGGLLIVLRDVSTLAATIQMKTDFVANASHELRTPISAIKVAFETLREVYQEQCSTSPDDALGNRCITIIHDHLRRLEEMLRDLLDLSRVESADLRPNLAPVRLREVFATLRSIWQPAARDKGVELTLPDGSAAGDSDLMITSDRRLLDLILKNLVENAIKFTPTGGTVEVICERRDAADGQPETIVLTVSDSGCGIPPEHVERVFERFYQVDPARSGTAGRGTGLGLAIVKHAANALSGHINLTSRLGSGTRIVCTLPVLDAAER